VDVTFTPQRLTERSVRKFRGIIYRHYLRHPRSLPWRRTRNPYRILVSEIMLQQTQVERVTEKYREFIKKFPDFPALAEAPLCDILRAWQGLGYNRRAIALHRTARIVMTEFQGRLPSTVPELLQLPGIGTYTASAIAAFAFNEATVFVETNIRRVFIHFFFHDHEGIRDTEIMPLVEKTLDSSDPREWYYALMDYGVTLGKGSENPNRRSAHYQKQTPFHGSNRQARGMILKVLVEKGKIPESELIRRMNMDRERIEKNLDALESEGFMRRKGKSVILGEARGGRG
jgi:A/G-specific adenine glycosylase